MLKVFPMAWVKLIAGGVNLSDVLGKTLAFYSVRLFVGVPKDDVIPRVPCVRK